MKIKTKADDIVFGISNIVTHAVVWFALMLMTLARSILDKMDIQQTLPKG